MSSRVSIISNINKKYVKINIMFFLQKRFYFSNRHAPFDREHYKNVYDPPRKGETEEEWRKRVPNIYSPCKRATDVIDVPFLDRNLIQLLDDNVHGHNYKEQPVVKMSPQYQIGWVLSDLWKNPGATKPSH